MCLHRETSAGTAEKAHGGLTGNDLSCFTGTHTPRTQFQTLVSLSFLHDVLWTAPQCQVLPLLGCWTHPNVVAKSCRKAEWLGGPESTKFPQVTRLSNTEESFVSCPLLHDPPQLVFAFPVQHSWLLNQVSCCPCHCSAASPGHCTCAPQRGRGHLDTSQCSSSNPLSDSSACGGGTQAIPPRR